MSPALKEWPRFWLRVGVCCVHCAPYCGNCDGGISSRCNLVIGAYHLVKFLCETENRLAFIPLSQSNVGFAKSALNYARLTSCDIFTFVTHCVPANHLPLTDDHRSIPTGLKANEARPALIQELIATLRNDREK